jgi:hypothetical protein
VETILLDSAHGMAETNKFILEQHWVVDGEDVVRIVIEYNPTPDGKMKSSAELLLLTGMTEYANNTEAMLRLREFPSQWWGPGALTNVYIRAEPPQMLLSVATGLLDRYVALCTAGKAAQGS